MRIVLIGKNGQLGWELQRTLPALGKVIALGRDELDLSAPDAIHKTILALKPDLIVNAAAYTEVDLAETETDLAMQINGTAPGVLAELSRAMGAGLIHYSTDYVFDGRKTAPYVETDPTQPLNEYGKSKLLGEDNIKQAGDAYLILRTSWLYSLRGNSFVNKVLAWARKTKNLKIVRDQIGSPTWARALAESTSRMLAAQEPDLLDALRERRGIYHLAGSGLTSRYEWAKLILAADPNPTEQLVQTIEPVSSDEFPTPAARPLFSALDCTRFEATFQSMLPDWKDSLRRAMQR